MINTVEKIYNWENNFDNYKVTYVDGKISFVPNNDSKHRLPSNSDMDSRWWSSNR